MMQPTITLTDWYTNRPLVIRPDAITSLQRLEAISGKAPVTGQPYHMTARTRVDTNEDTHLVVETPTEIMTIATTEPATALTLEGTPTS